MYDLITIGDPTIDTHVQIAEDCDECEVMETHKKHLCFEYGGKIPIIDSFQSLGGNAPNVAIAAHKLGLHSSLVSTVGRDAYGDMALQELTKYGIDTDFVTVSTNHKTRYSIVLNYRAERTILSYSDKKQYTWPEKFPEAAWIYYTGLSAGFEQVHEQLLAYLAEHRTVRLAVNPGSYMLKYAPAALRDAIAHADVLILNNEEARKILEMPTKQTASETELLRALLAAGAKEVVLTDGENGAWAGNKEEVWHCKRFPVDVVAKTGAGDAFSAGYLAARNKNHDIAHAVLWGAANGAAVVSAHGPHAGLLDEAGMEKMLQRFSSIKPTAL